jgi:hypothetical protein
LVESGWIGVKMTSNIKIWTTLPEALFREVKKIGEEFGYADAELFRELIRRGLISFKQLQEVKLPSSSPQKPGAILKVAAEIGDTLDLEDLPNRFKKKWT